MVAIGGSAGAALARDVGQAVSVAGEDCVETASPPGSPRIGGPERPDDEHRLEEEANEAFCVGVEPEGVGPLEPLGDIAGEVRRRTRRRYRPTIRAACWTRIG